MVDKEKPNGLKRILHWILLGLCGLALLYVAILVIWYFSFSSDKVAEQLGKFAEQELDATLSIDKTSLDLFPTPSIHLQGVQSTHDRPSLAGPQSIQVGFHPRFRFLAPLAIHGVTDCP